MGYDNILWGKGSRGKRFDGFGAAGGKTEIMEMEKWELKMRLA